MKTFITIVLLLISCFIYPSELKGWGDEMSKIELKYGQGPVVYEYDKMGNVKSVVDRRKVNNVDCGDDSYIDYRHDKIISSRAAADHSFTETYAKNDMSSSRGEMSFSERQRLSDNIYQNDNARHDDYKYTKSGRRISEGYINGRYVDVNENVDVSKNTRSNREEKISDLGNLFKNTVKISLSTRAKSDLAKISDDQFQTAYDVIKVYGNAIVKMPSSLSFLKKGVKEIDLSFEADPQGISATIQYPCFIIRVNCYSRQEYDCIYETVLHEFGHVLEYWLWGECLYVYKGHDDLAKEWLSISGWHRDRDGTWQNEKKGIVNEYAGEQPSEDFAESVLCFFSGIPLVNEKKEFISNVLNINKA